MERRIDGPQCCRDRFNGGHNRKTGGQYSGQPEVTEDFRITFDQDGTFHYICEPHVSMDMVGVVTVGTGVAPPAPSAEPEAESVPGSWARQS